MGNIMTREGHALLLDQLLALKAQGLAFSDCIAAFAAPKDDPFAAAARTHYHQENSMEVDDNTIVCVGDEGAFVQCWLWIGNGEAGIRTAALEAVLAIARRTGNAAPGNFVDWLEDTLLNFSGEIDDIHLFEPVHEPGAIRWVDKNGRCSVFRPSTAILALLVHARQHGLAEKDRETVATLLERHGERLDGILRALYAPAEELLATTP